VAAHVVVEPVTPLLNDGLGVLEAAELLAGEEPPIPRRRRTPPRDRRRHHSLRDPSTNFRRATLADAIDLRPCGFPSGVRARAGRCSDGLKTRRFLFMFRARPAAPASTVDQDGRPVRVSLPSPPTEPTGATSRVRTPFEPARSSAGRAPRQRNRARARGSRPEFRRLLRPPYDCPTALLRLRLMHLRDVHPSPKEHPCPR
jgi:hypothetical protein